MMDYFVCRSDPPTSTEGALTWSEEGPLPPSPGHVRGHILPSASLPGPAHWLHLPTSGQGPGPASHGAQLLLLLRPRRPGPAIPPTPGTNNANVPAVLNAGPSVPGDAADDARPRGPHGPIRRGQHWGRGHDDAPTGGNRQLEQKMSQMCQYFRSSLKFTSR